MLILYALQSHVINVSLNIIHAQLRMNCSNKLPVADSPSRSFTNPIKDPKHYFLESPLCIAENKINFKNKNP